MHKIKGQAIFFLVEMLLLASVVLLMMYGASKLVSLESKYLDFDAYNLALFLERVPSIEGNFRYQFNFNTNVSVDFYPDRIALDNALETEKDYKKRFVKEYSNPVSFRLNKIKIKKAEKLFFYKIGNSLLVRDKIDPLLEYKLNIKNTEVEEYKSSPIKKTNTLNLLSPNELIPEENKVYYSSIVNHNLNSLIIKYNMKGKLFAYDIYNRLIGTEFSKNVDKISLVPIQDYSELCDDNVVDFDNCEKSILKLDNVPFIIFDANTKDYEGYLG